MIFANLEKLPPDPILGVTTAFRADPSPDKIDLGVGVYRDDAGNTPVPAAVRDAERALLDGQVTKTYVGPMGNLEFNQRIVEMALGPVAAGLKERTTTIQTVGGCGALRVGAELIRASRPDAIVHVSDPTWANHEPLLGSSGLGTRALSVLRTRESRRRVRAHARALRAPAFRVDRAAARLLSQPDRGGPRCRAVGRARRGHRGPRTRAVRGSRLPGVRRRSRDRRAGPAAARDPRAAAAARALVLEELRSLPRAHRGTRGHRRERDRGRRDRDAPGAHARGACTRCRRTTARPSWRACSAIRRCARRGSRNSPEWCPA